MDRPDGRKLRHRTIATVRVVGLFAIAAILCSTLLDGIAQIAVLSGLGVLVTALVVWFVPRWQADAAHDLKNTSRTEYENEARKTVAEVLGGLLLVTGLAVTWIQLADSRQQAATQQELSREGQLTDRFTAAVDQLGSEKLQVRLGGIFALERIARDSSDDAPAVLEVLTAFVRESAPWPLRGDATPAPDVLGLYHPEEDIQAVLSVLERSNWEALPAEALPGGCLDLSRTDLRGARFRGVVGVPICLVDADLTGADLQGAKLDRANLEGADLEEADLRAASLLDANMRGADLELANLDCESPAGEQAQCANLEGVDLSCRALVGGQQQCADLRGVTLRGANLTDALLPGADLGCVEVWSVDGPYLNCATLARANLTRALLDVANLAGASLEGAILVDASLVEADLTEANLGQADVTGADFKDATLTNADLNQVNTTNAINLTQAQLDSAIWGLFDPDAMCPPTTPGSQVRPLLCPTPTSPTSGRGRRRFTMPVEAAKVAKAPCRGSGLLQASVARATHASPLIGPPFDTTDYSGRRRWWSQPLAGPIVSRATTPG
ncbi:MAG TPA: pentapeptide repeat-containing protein [Thermomicrobiales bacterium]|nr:pentapeptide repeat-containing protein [Thermomicrobiales bacterium]